MRPKIYSQQGRHTFRRGFSLIEMLMVLVIVVALGASLVDVYLSVVQAAALTSAANSLENLLIEARAQAISQNTTVEVRLYDIAGSTDPNPAYRAFQLHWVRPDGSRPAITLMVYLPATVVIDSTAQHSSLIASDPIATSPDSSDVNLNAQTRVFHFLSDGSTDLPTGTIWDLTLRAATQSDPANFPSNWASITIDPVTGRAQVFRP